MNKIPCPFCNASIEDDSIFCDHCGKKLPQQASAVFSSPILTLNCAGENMRFTLRDGNVIGRRSPDTPQLATFALVSGNHAQVHQTSKGIWSIIDIGSTNGTWVNGQKLIPGLSRVLNIGDKVQIATLLFVVE